MRSYRNIKNQTDDESFIELVEYFSLSFNIYVRMYVLGALETLKWISR